VSAVTAGRHGRTGTARAAGQPRLWRAQDRAGSRSLSSGFLPHGRRVAGGWGNSRSTTRPAGLGNLQLRRAWVPLRIRFDPASDLVRAAPTYILQSSASKRMQARSRSHGDPARGRGVLHWVQRALRKEAAVFGTLSSSSIRGRRCSTSRLVSG